MVSLFQLAVTIGILVSYIVDRALAPAQAWRWMLGLASVPGALLVVGMLPLPESPRWLIKNGTETAARRVLALLRSPATLRRTCARFSEDLAHNLPTDWID